MSSTYASPRKPPTPTLSFLGETTTLDAQRSEIRQAHRDNLYCCSPDEWLETYAPFRLDSEGLADQVEDQLRGNVFGKDGWHFIREAMKIRDASKNVNENRTFEHLGSIAEEVLKAARNINQDLWPTAVARPTPTKSMQSEVPGPKIFPDWRSSLRRTPAPAIERIPTRLQVKKEDQEPSNDDFMSDSAADTCMIAEFKLFSTSSARHDNEGKILGGANHLLYNDPCRRHVNAFTIEHDQLRFWHFSRSHIAASKRVSINQKPKYLIRILLFALFGAEEDLGYDPTVQRVLWEEKGGKRVETTEFTKGKTCLSFRYKIDGEWYETVGDPISEIAAYRMVGRATRVWKVRKYRSPDERRDGREHDDHEYALKDVWLYEDALLERPIRDSIFAKLSPEEGETAAKHFLTIKADEVVSVDSHQQITPVRDSLAALDWTVVPKGSVAGPAQSSQTRTGSRDRNMESAPALPRPRGAPHAHARPKARKHVRTLFVEIAHSVYELTDFKSILICLRDVVKALRIMKKAGFVHRDASAGNCLFFIDRGILSDLEYAKPFDQVSTGDPKTGTPDYMAVEYQQRRHYYPFKQAEGYDPRAQIVFKDWFVYHYVHDVESVHWQYLWSLHHRVTASAIGAIRKDPLLYHIVKAISNGQKQYFGRAPTDRRRVIESYAVEIKKTRMPFAILYQMPGLVGLLEPITLAQDLAAEYEYISQLPLEQLEHEDGTLEWKISDDAFRDGIYDRFERVLTAAAESAESLTQGKLVSMSVLLGSGDTQTFGGLQHKLDAAIQEEE